MSTNTPDQNLIDTSTIISSLNYYTALHPPFHDWVKKQFTSGRWVLLDKVLKECNDGPIIRRFQYLKSSVIQYSSVLNTHPEYEEWILQNCKNPKRSKDTSEKRYEKARKRELDNHADLHLLCTAHESNGTLGIITEESRAKTEKPFDKIPTIADKMGVNCITLPEYLYEHGVTIDFDNLP